jgi:hypothetical protein
MSYKDKEVLRKLYVEQELSMAEVAEKLNCGKTTVSEWVNKFGFNTGRLTDSQRSEISLTSRQHSLIKGTLMGDGCVVRRGDDNKNPQYRISMKNEEFIRWLSDELQPLSSSVKLRKGEYAETLDNPQYIMTTYSHSLLQEYANWYSSGNKRWPVEESFTPLELKMLYVTDGTPVKHTDNWAMRISAINECDRKEQVSDMFSRELDIDISWHSSDKNRDGTIYIPSKDSGLILNKEPVPGFEYKWPNSL